MSTEFLTKAPGHRIPYLVESVESPAGQLLLIHGIFSEKTEDGRFDRLAAHLAAASFASVRFDYVGHGEHNVASREFTIAGALSDFVHMAAFARNMQADTPFSIVASSFGGSLALLYLLLKERIRPAKLVLLNPVTDYEVTFLRPRERQMQERFTEERLTEARTTGEAEFGDGFVLGLPLLLEFQVYRPFESFEHLDVPTLVIHGDSDSAVPYDVTRTYARRAPHLTFETIRSADHAFVEPAHEAESFRLVKNFLKS